LLAYVTVFVEGNFDASFDLWFYMIPASLYSET